MPRTKKSLTAKEVEQLAKKPSTHRVAHCLDVVAATARPQPSRVGTRHCVAANRATERLPS
jgi:hypothetical protein